MQHIESAQNRMVKWLKSLKDKKNRDETQRYMLEGEKMVREAQKAGLAELIAAEDGMYPDLISAAEDAGIEVYTMPKAVFKLVSDAQSPQGILAILAIPQRKWAIKEFKSHLIALENVQDPGNVGTTIRTAEAAGFSGVLLCGNCADPYSPKTVRSAMGSIMRVPVYTDCTIDRLQELKEAGYTLCAGDLRGQDTLEKTERAVLLVGSEAGGLSGELLTLAQKRFRLPMKGQAESLNAAVFAGIAMYALTGITLT
ncbi:MAG: TrmH family RNA methyltransferase [Christensenellales bacterium]